jgi:hypothetical protein
MGIFEIASRGLSCQIKDPRGKSPYGDSSSNRGS